MTSGIGHIAALPIVVPLIAAAVMAMSNPLPRRVHEAVALTVAIANVVMCALLLAHVKSGPLVYWLGGWKPHHGVAVGISLTVDQLGAGTALLTSVLVALAILYSTRYFVEDIDGNFYALMLVFMAGMAGFVLTGDLFNMFVFFELMGVAAYALTALKVEESGPLQGAINFAVTNSVAGFAALAGIGLLYGRTGALNLAQVGQALAQHRADSLVAVAFLLVVMGFLTKAAAVPLHFWLADAHAVAPAPICILFSGVMVELGVFGAARVLATAFAPHVAPHTHDLRAVLVGIGVLTAVVAAVNCVEQRHLKRLLAFSTVSHIGVLICGLGLLTDHGLAGAATYALGHGLTKAALFMAAGTLLYRHARIDEFQLHGKARNLPLLALVWVVGGLLLASAPLGTTFFGKSLVEDAALAHRYWWLPAVLALCGALTGGAVLRAGGRMFFGLGSPERVGMLRDESEDRSQAEESEAEGREFEGQERTPPLLVVLPVVTIAAAVVAGLIPGLVPSIESAAAHFRDYPAYAQGVLGGHLPAYPRLPETHVHVSALIYAAASVAGAIVVAAVGLFGSRLGERVPRPVLRPAGVALNALRDAHSGHIGDYVAWWTLGISIFGGLFLWAITA